MELPASLVGDEYETPPLQDRCQAHPSFSEPHSCIYVWCRTCNAQESCENSGFLFHPDETGSPCILPLSDAALLFPRIPEPTECTGSMSIAAFTELYLPYLAAQKLPLKPCPIPALLRLQENQQYDW